MFEKIAATIKQEKMKQTEEKKRVPLRLNEDDHNNLIQMANELNISINKFLIYLIREAAEEFKEYKKQG